MVTPGMYDLEFSMSGYLSAAGFWLDGRISLHKPSLTEATG